MIELTTLEEFKSDQKLDVGLNYNTIRSVFVDVSAGTASLEIETPNGWASVTEYTTNTFESFSIPTSVTFRFALSGGAKAYLV